MMIDDAQTHVLTKYSSTKGGQVKVESDHNVLYSRFSVTYRKIKVKILREIFNVKNQECMKKFTELTTNADKFSRCYDPENL